jgi:Transcriptional activator of glycolytic enzymes
MLIKLLDQLHFDSVKMQYEDDAEIAPSTIPPLQGVAVTYKSTLDSLMSFVHATPPYTRDKTYTKAELRALTPENVLHWMNLKAFGVEDPPMDANPTLARGNSLAFWKKAISFFMPNRLMVWVSGRNEGNPTRSIEVNNLIKRVKKKEVRKQGAASQCRRAITEVEFRTMQKILQNHNRTSTIWRFGLYALTNFQFHLLARIDDTTQVLVENLRVHDSFCNALKTRLNWSKNVSEERDAPWQVVLGSMDTAFCVLVSLSLWMEVNLRSNPNALLSPYLFNFCDDNSIPAGGQKSKETAQIMFHKVFKMEEFNNAAVIGADNMLGSHSIRKFAATHARRSGCSKDDKDIRGRWKSKARVSDVYEDTELPFPDAKVAEKLCIGGACYYLFPEELSNTEVDEAGNSTIAMLKTFILSNVVPNTRKRLPDSAALVLGKALLWLIYSPYNATHNVVPQDLKNRIRMEWNEIVSAGDVNLDCNSTEYNPIRRVPVVVTGDQGCVYIDIVPSFEEADVGGGQIVVGGARATTGGIQAQLLALQSQSSQIRRELQELRTNQMADRVFSAKNYGIINTNIRRIALQPGVRGGLGGTVARGNDDNLFGAPLAIAGLGIAPASLSPNPKNLFDLWQEYQIGIGGRKAAKHFSQSERGGKTKHKYCRRKVIWLMVRGMVKLGMTADSAIDQIYAVYGQQTCVTRIINLIKKDKERGTLNPNLRV